MTSLLILNGPNLNLLGTRQPDVYGATTLSELDEMCIARAASHQMSCDCQQSNHEGALIDLIHAARSTHDGIVLNGGAYTHTSIALMDAIISAEVPVIEVHLSNIHAREDFRHRSYIARAAVAQIAGLGPLGYLLAIDAFAQRLRGA